MVAHLWSANLYWQAPERLRRPHQAVEFAFPQRFAIAAIVALMLAVAAINAIEPLIIKAIFDGLASPGATSILVVSLGALAAIAIVRELMDGAANWLTWRTRIGLQYALLEATVGKLHKLPLQIQRSEGVGAIMTRLDRSIQGFTGAVSLILFNVLPSVIFLSIAIFIMLRLDWRLAAIVLIFAPMPAIIAMAAAPEQTRRAIVARSLGAHLFTIQ
jgi:ATP-binding cassette, subfamily B, bacterial